MSYEEKIKRGLLLYLREVHKITAIDAEIGMTEFEAGSWEGCDTCGYGADEDEVWTPLRFKRAQDKYWDFIKLDTVNSVNLLPELLPYIDRANG